MQRHAYLIMAHNNWYTLEKLIRLLDVPWNDIYLHIDKKVKDFSQEYYKSIPYTLQFILPKGIALLGVMKRKSVQK